MKAFKYIRSVAFVLFSAGILTTSTIYIDKVSAEPTNGTIQSSQITQTTGVSPHAIVNNPKTYLNKSIVMKAKFDKFSTLGLDYKPAMRSSDDYISFLIKREDTTHSIPLSEMKLFLKRDLAEKYIDLKTDDKIEIKGTVFSDALGDAWIDVSQLTIIEKAPDTAKNKA